MTLTATAKFSGTRLKIELDANAPVIRRATLWGDYLYGKEVRVAITPAGKILDCDVVHCVWSGQEKFDAWFRQNYNPKIVMEAVG